VTTPSWNDVLPTPLPGARLQEIWMTSFEQPDAGLMVEHLLPSLLGASYSIVQDVQGRALFFGELCTALEVLHGRITVISSAPRAARDESQYPWLWRYLSHFIVGAEGHATQHAKLWAFHWRAGDKEHLELHISSTNLTASAFKGQLQAGWKVLLPLGDNTTQKARTWGELIPFLEALGASAGNVAATRIQRLLGLLSRAKCPPEFTFVASIPGGKSAARQLARFDPSELYILTPTIGEWDKKSLTKWGRDVGIEPSNIHLKWISEKHLWAANSGWTLSTTTGKVLKECNVQVECLPTIVKLTEEHDAADLRWSHAKLYLLCGRQNKLLVTSANWSTAAWGAKEISPRNFELGVIFETEWMELEQLGKPFDPPNSVPFYVDSPANESRTSPLGWAEGCWDGESIVLRARSTDLDAPISAIIAFAGGSEEGTPLVDGAATLPWEDPIHPPLTARYTQGSQTLDIDVIDLRRPSEFAKTPLPEVDPAIARDLREAFLLQRYGGPLVDPDHIPGLSLLRRVSNGNPPPGDYTLKAFIDARAAFGVVDKWRDAIAEAAGDPDVLERVRLDGAELRALYSRRKDEGPGYELVIDELDWHLEEEV
jgi:Tyrosyl-DNA phosphodiesterase